MLRYDTGPRDGRRIFTGRVTRQLPLEGPGPEVDAIALVQHRDPRPGVDEDHGRESRIRSISTEAPRRRSRPLISGKAGQTGSAGFTRSGSTWARRASRATAFLLLPSRFARSRRRSYSSSAMAVWTSFLVLGIRSVRYRFPSADGDDEMAEQHGPAGFRR